MLLVVRPYVRPMVGSNAVHARWGPNAAQNCPKGGPIGDRTCFAEFHRGSSGVPCMSGRSERMLDPVEGPLDTGQDCSGPVSACFAPFREATPPVGVAGREAHRCEQNWDLRRPPLGGRKPREGPGREPEPEPEPKQDCDIPAACCLVLGVWRECRGWSSDWVKVSF